MYDIEQRGKDLLELGLTENEVNLLTTPLNQVTKESLPFVLIASNRKVELIRAQKEKALRDAPKKKPFELKKINLAGTTSAIT